LKQVGRKILKKIAQSVDAQGAAKGHRARNKPTSGQPPVCPILRHGPTPPHIHKVSEKVSGTLDFSRDMIREETASAPFFVLEINPCKYE